MSSMWHLFTARVGDVLIGEVSSVNDDNTDNYFQDPIGRFSDVEEDIEPLYFLVSDHFKWLN